MAVNYLHRVLSWKSRCPISSLFLYLNFNSLILYKASLISLTPKPLTLASLSALIHLFQKPFFSTNSLVNLHVRELVGISIINPNSNNQSPYVGSNWSHFLPILLFWSWVGQFDVEFVGESRARQLRLAGTWIRFAATKDIRGRFAGIYCVRLSGLCRELNILLILNLLLW